MGQGSRLRRRIDWPPDQQARLRHTAPTPKKRIRHATKQIERFWATHVKRMELPEERYSLKVDDWRVILRPTNLPGVYEVEHFDHRSDVYIPYPHPDRRR